MILPECQQLPVRTCSKDAPDRPPMRGGRCTGYFFPRESPGRTLAGGLASSREQVASASSPHLFSRSDDSAFYFLHFRAVAAAVAMARAASCGTQRARPVPVKPTCVTCQSDGTDLSPANLSRCSSSCAISHYAAIVHAASAYSESCHPASRTPTQRHCSKLERRTLWRRNCGTW